MGGIIRPQGSGDRPQAPGLGKGKGIRPFQALVSGRGLITINPDARPIEGANETGEILEPIVARTGTTVATVPEVEALVASASLASVALFEGYRSKVVEAVEIY